MREENRQAIERLAVAVKQGYPRMLQGGRRGWSVSVGDYSPWSGSGYYIEEGSSGVLMRETWDAPYGCHAKVASDAAHEVFKRALEEAGGNANA